MLSLFKNQPFLKLYQIQPLFPFFLFGHFLFESWVPLSSRKIPVYLSWNTFTAIKIHTPQNSWFCPCPFDMFMISSVYFLDWLFQFVSTFLTVSLIHHILLSFQSGCCKPSNDCNFEYINPTNWTQGATPSTQNPDCAKWSNEPTKLCYSCDSCKAGLLDNIKSDWKRVAVINIVFLVFLIIVYTIGCCAFRNNREDNSWKRYPWFRKGVDIRGWFWNLYTDFLHLLHISASLCWFLGVQCYFFLLFLGFEFILFPPSSDSHMMILLFY